eukprot:scaffold124628_cov39-Tisochrysis_lutea.AAC.3
MNLGTGHPAPACPVDRCAPLRGCGGCLAGGLLPGVHRHLAGGHPTSKRADVNVRCDGTWWHCRAVHGGCLAGRFLPGVHPHMADGHPTSEYV